MGQLNVEVNTTEGINTDYISELDKAGSLFDGIEGGGASGPNLMQRIQGVFGGTYDELGISEDHVPTMQSSIETYVTALETKISEVEGMVDETSFFGEYAQGVADYVDAIAYGCKVIVGKLRQFKDDLGKISTAYQTFDTNLDSALEGQQEELNSSFQSIAYEGSSGSSEQN